MADCKQDTEENGNFKMANQSMNILDQHRIIDVLAQNLDAKRQGLSPIGIFSQNVAKVSIYFNWSKFSHFLSIVMILGSGLV